jgi:PAS domain S-box-containing protein
MKLVSENSTSFLGLIDQHAMLLKTNPQGVITFVNDKFCEVSGHKREEILGKNYSIINSDQFFQNVTDILTQKSSWSGIFRNKSKEGVDFWVVALISAVSNQEGEVQEILTAQYPVADINEKLWQNTATLETIIKSFPAAIHETLINENWTMTFVSSFMESITGYPASDFINDHKRSFVSIVHKEDFKKAEELVLESLKKNVPYNVRYRILNSKGEERWIQEKGALASDEKKIVGALFDITEEMELRQTLEAYQKGIGSTSIIAFTDDQGVITWVNDRYCEISGYAQDELVGRTHRVLQSGFHTEEFYHELWSTITSGKAWHGHIKNKAKDGSYYWVDTTISPIMEAGKIKRFVSFMHDITVQKQKELIDEEISMLRSRFIKLSSNRKKFFDYLNAKVIELTDSEYGFIGQTIEGENGRYLKTFSLTDISWDAETRKIFQDSLVSGMLFKNHNSLFGVVLKTGRVVITNSPSSHPSSAGIPKGHAPLHSFMGIPLYHSGEFIAMIGLANRKAGYSEKLYQDLMKFFESIAEMIHAFFMEEELQRQKSITLHNARLVSIGQLAAGVGHEINNPLAIITGYLSIAQQLLEKNGHLDPKIGEIFEKIKTANGRIANIVKGLRSFARSDEVQKVAFDFHELVNETLFMISDIYKKEGVNVSYNGPQNPVYFSGNRGRIQQVLVNIISNAKDATEGKTERNINIKLEVISEEIKLIISDNGHGIPDHVREKIFDPFFTTKEVNVGTGIGLSLVNNIIKEHEGHIEVDSIEGKGARFIIVLPGKLSSSFQKAIISSTATRNTSWIGGKILILDDEPEIRDLLNLFLTPACDKVLIAQSGREAIDIISREKIDIIISDMQMPALDGLSFYRQLKQKFKRMPEFIFITGGVAMSSEDQTYIEENGISILSKPFTEEMLFEGLKTLKA